MTAKKKNSKGAGRKLFDGKDESVVVAKLREVTALDASIEECVYYADISKDSYYRYLKANPDFALELTKMRERPVLLARQTVVKKMGESFQNSMDYLKRKKKKEFSDGSDTGKVNIYISTEHRDNSKEAIKAYLDETLEKN